MKDPEIRQLLKRRISAQHRKERDMAVFDELPLCRQGRADVAVVNGALWGYEIKSQHDSTSRLASQVRMYDEVFDYCEAVVAAKHRRSVLTKLPAHWGVTVATEDGDFEQVRPAKLNDGVSIDALIWLMWKDEARRVLRDRDIAIPAFVPVTKIWDALRTVPVDDLKAAVRGVLKARSAVVSDRIPA